MSRPGYTTKPCEGCGVTGHRQTGKVCHDCQAAIEEGRRAREKEADALAQGKVLVRYWTEAAHMNQYLGDRGIMEALRQMVVAFAEPATDQRWHGPDEPLEPRLPGRSGPTDLYRSARLLVTPAERDAFRALEADVVRALSDAEAKGYRDGSNILNHLHDGSLGIADYEARRAKAGA